MKRIEHIRPKLIWGQLLGLLPILSAIYVPTLILLGLVVIVCMVTNVPIGYYVRDPVRIMEAPRYVGLLSNLGVLIWCATSIVCLFSYAALRNKTNNKEMSGFLLFAGLLTGILMLDDLFLGHEKVQEYIPEAVVYAGYLAIILFYLIRFTDIILKTDFLILAFALLFFGLSIAGDIYLIRIPEDFRLLFEDGSKLLGIVSWFTYFTRVSLKYVSGFLEDSERTPR